MTPLYNDVMNEVAIAIYEMEENKYNNIVSGGYLLRYCQRIAFYIVNSKSLKSSMAYERQKIATVPIPENLSITDKGQRITSYDTIQKLIDNDLQNKEYWIPAKMFLYSVKYGSIKKYSESSGISYGALKKYVAAYKKRLKKWHKKLES